MDASQFGIPRILITSPESIVTEYHEQQPDNVEKKKDTHQTTGLRSQESPQQESPKGFLINARQLSRSTSGLDHTTTTEDSEVIAPVPVKRNIPSRITIRRSKSTTSLRNKLPPDLQPQSSKHSIAPCPSGEYTNPLNPEDIHRAIREKSLGQVATKALKPMVTTLYECTAAPLPDSPEKSRQHEDTNKRFRIVRQMGIMGSFFNRHIPHELKQRKLGGGYLDFSPRTPFECIAHNIRTILMSPSSLPGRFVNLGAIKRDDQNIDFGSGDDLQASSMIVDQFADLLVNILKIAKSDDQYTGKHDLINRFRNLVKDFQACRTQGLASQECCAHMLTIFQEILQCVPMIESASETELNSLTMMERTLAAASKVPVEAEAQKALLDLISMTFREIRQGHCVEDILGEFEQLADEVSLIGSDTREQIATEKQEHKHTIEALESSYNVLQNQKYKDTSASITKKVWKKKMATLTQELDASIKAKNEQFREKLAELSKQAKTQDKQRLAEWKNKLMDFARRQTDRYG
ncbi:hypothetical protein [Endozoicomonas euniceicola]|uniref:Uncharacterized protein n=1 Tax=Endozoicomonas euniceicola TaxID=1234143 RepID=A0ABY6GTK2_9GAMM|nr:hypothetical protein [Endozoicomonas euniceicola]UYM16101.1 hypothetical protein NX720_25425 [Endozoicomonas euniceicola]